MTQSHSSCLEIMNEKVDRLFRYILNIVEIVAKANIRKNNYQTSSTNVFPFTTYLLLT